MRFYLIDALRGVAAFWVMMFHAYGGGHIDNFANLLPEFIVVFLFRFGESGVPIFFVISGFVIAHSFREAKVDGSFFAKFTLRRSVRLDPPYWASIALVIALAAVSAIAKKESFELPSAGLILAHMFYLQAILEMTHLNIIYWTLCLEIQFYLVFCLLMWVKQILSKRTKLAFQYIAAFIFISSLLWPTKILELNPHPGLFFPHWHAFVLGVLAYWSWTEKLPKSLFYLYFIIVFGCSIYYGSHFSLYSSVTAIFVHECALRGWMQSANWRWIQFLGLISYSLYLTHNPITGASYFLFNRLIGDSAAAQAISFVLTSSICILFAYCFWWLFERWSVNLSRKIAK